MSTQINQYLIYGISLPYDWHKEWEKAKNGNLKSCEPGYVDFYTASRDYLYDSAFDANWPQKDGITLLFDGRDGRFIIIGHCLAKAKHGDYLGERCILEIPSDPVPASFKEYLKTEVKRVFGVEGIWKIYLVTKFR